MLRVPFRLAAGVLYRTFQLSPAASYFLFSKSKAMPAKTEELTLIYRRERVRFDNSDVAILECEEPEVVGNNGNGKATTWLTAKGIIVKAECPPDELVQGLSYRFYGHFTTHDKYGQQFAARTYVRCQPHGKAGIIRYLQTTCAGFGMGKVTAEKLWDKFQGDAVRILREQPEVAVAAVGMSHFTEEKAAAASSALLEESALESVSIDLIDLLGGRGFPRDTPKKTVQEWGNRAAELVKRNPYLLMRFRGVGYVRTDRMYLDMGGNPSALKRQALAAWHSIASDTEGNTWHAPITAEIGIRSRVGGTKLNPAGAMKLCKRAGILSVQRDEENKPWLAETRKADNERFIAQWVMEALDEGLQ